MFEQTGHARIYEAAGFYDRAFGYRDFRAETDFLVQAAARHAGRLPRSVLELAAGPANHAVALAGRGLDATALDREPAMRRYGLEKAEAAGVALDYRLGDMTDFTLDRPVDLALLLLGSAANLLTNDAVIRCFARTRAALAPGGVLIVELPHPRDVFDAPEPGTEGWEVEEGKTRIRVRWGSPNDRFDPVTQVATVSVTLTVWQDGRKKVLRDQAPQRRFTACEMDALARLAGLEPAGWYGALDLAVPFGTGDESWRMVTVLRNPDRPASPTP